MLSHMTGTPFTGRITRRTNLTSAEILAAIPVAFAGAQEGDLSLFYYAGHGKHGGQLLGTDALDDDSLLITPLMLRQALDQIPGTKLVIIDACYSGGIIGNGSISNATVDES